MMKDSFQRRYNALNAQQKKAVDTVEGPVLVIAGPGSGKTEIVSLRVANILQTTHATPGNILCLTFTDAAATNMRNRLSSLIGDAAYRVAIHTFHSFARELIDRHKERFYGAASMNPADEVTRFYSIEQAIKTYAHGHPIKSEHPEQGFVYAKPLMQAIGYAKKAGISPKELQSLLDANKEDMIMIEGLLQGVLSERVVKGDIAKLEVFVRDLERKFLGVGSNIVGTPWNRYVIMFLDALKYALDESKNADETKPLSAWKKEWLEKKDGLYVLKDSGLRFERMNALVHIYSTYRTELFAKGYYDFDDMILDVLLKLESDDVLRAEVQEEYQYILVDEFQDTNDAQMRIIRAIADAPVNEGKPNLMVVGDDDQAIYKFQGANISNVLLFKNEWKDVEVVSMTHNYRSTQPILDLAATVIDRGVPVHQKKLLGGKKDLVSSNGSLVGGALLRVSLPTEAHEHHFVASEIRTALDAGVDPDSIAVIARKHEELERLVSFLKAQKIPVRYEREQNVLLEPHVREIITIVRYAHTVIDKEIETADYLLPEILSFPFWGVSRLSIWKVSIDASKNRLTWLEAMNASPDDCIQNVARFLIALSVDATHEPIERVVDTIIGGHVELYRDSDDDEEASIKKMDKMVSPFKQFYFSKERFDHARSEYVSFLSSLRTFIGALREYKRGEYATVRDLVEFVEMRERNDMPLNDLSPFSNAKKAVTLLSAHKSKGLEFDYVFVLSCVDSMWVGKGRPRLLPFPYNIPVEPAGDGEDDKARLFYVTLTRAKRHLTLTSFRTHVDGRESTPLRFVLPGVDAPHISLEKIVDIADGPHVSEVLEASEKPFHGAPFRGEENALLLSLLDGYKMSVTHLNNFLDITKGGPARFLETNLLRFPQQKTVSGAYGTAIHFALSWFLNTFKEKGVRPSTDATIVVFRKSLSYERLSKYDETNQGDRGELVLRSFLDAKQDSFTRKDMSEIDFSSQGSHVGGALISGKIDRVIERDGVFEVIDYKTGRAYEEWSGKSDGEKIKLRNYERQLVFYALLIETSRSYSTKKVENGQLLFVEPVAGRIFELEKKIAASDVSKLKILIEKVYNLITTLSFPDTSLYTQDIDGVIAFEEDIIAGKFDHIA
jgi:DNA helicase-2/ATP-dependent DNA helicase PcrA